MTTPPDTAKLADEIEALAKHSVFRETWYSVYDPDTFNSMITCDGDCGPLAFHVPEEVAKVVVVLVNNHTTIIAALRELDTLKAENAKLREAMKSALKRLEKCAPGWGVAKDELRAALGGEG